MPRAAAFRPALRHPGKSAATALSESQRQAFARCFAMAGLILRFCIWLCAAGVGMALAAPGKMDLRRLVLAATLPIYWPLQSIAMGRALYGLAKFPHFQAKTSHRV